ncbi:hypothetical protein D9M70_511730 [compost metagenome]
MSLFFNGFDNREGTTAAVHCVRRVCNQLAQATKGAFQAIEEVAAARLIEFAAAWDSASLARARADALRALFNESVTRSNPAVDEVIDPSIEAELSEAWGALAHSGSPTDALRVLKLERDHPFNRTFRAELLGDARRALGDLEAGRHTQLVTAAENARQRLSKSGRSPISRTVSTPLLLKGLEFDHVLIPDATHYVGQRYAAAKLFYVAISRARWSLTIASSTPTLRFPLPNL